MNEGHRSIWQACSNRASTPQACNIAPHEPSLCAGGASLPSPHTCATSWLMSCLPRAHSGTGFLGWSSSDSKSLLLGNNRAKAQHQLTRQSRWPQHPWMSARKQAQWLSQLPVLAHL